MGRLIKSTVKKNTTRFSFSGMMDSVVKILLKKKKLKNRANSTTIPFAISKKAPIFSQARRDHSGDLCDTRR